MNADADNKLQTVAWATDIADGKEPNWAAVENPVIPASGARLLHEISAAFRAQTGDNNPLDPLFRWRHLDILSLLGSGGFGQVYRALDTTLHRHVALKLSHSKITNATDAGWILAEARNQARLRHPNIVAVYGADTADDRVGIWCDLVPGKTLEQCALESCPWPSTAIFPLLVPLLEALVYIHKRGMIHGDIKPANIMIQPNGEPMLMDFGAARLDNNSAATQGSPLFMAPELLAGKKLHQGADVFALGVTLYRILSGRMPWQASSIDELNVLQQRQPMPDWTAISHSFRSLLRQMLSPDPHNRPTMAEVLRQVQDLKSRPARWRKRTALALLIATLSAATVVSTVGYRVAEQSRDRVVQVKDVLIEAAESATPTRQSGPTTVLAMYEHLALIIEERLKDYPVALAEMRVVAGMGLSRLGSIEQGREVAESGLALMLDVHGDDARDLANNWLEIASVRSMTEDLNGAAQATIAALDYIKKMPEQEAAPLRLIAQNRLAILLGKQGRWHEEIAATRALLQSRQALYGENHVRTAVDHHNLASSLLLIGDVDLARQHEAQAIHLLGEAGESQSVKMAFAQYALAAIELEAENLERCAQLLDEVTRIYQSSLPPAHRNHQFVALMRAKLNLANGNTDIAIAALREITVLPGEEFAVTRSDALRALALAHMQLQQWSAAARVWRQAQQTRPDSMRPLEAFFAAAIEYSDYRNGDQTLEVVQTSLQAAIDQLRKNDLSKTRQFQKLTHWLGTL